MSLKVEVANLLADGRPRTLDAITKELFPGAEGFFKHETVRRYVDALIEGGAVKKHRVGRHYVYARVEAA